MLEFGFILAAGMVLNFRLGDDVFAQKDLPN